MSHRRYDYHTGLGEDAGESTLMVTTTPSGETTRQGGGTDWGSIITGALPTLLSVYQQRELTRMNVARINAGQPPLSVQEYTSNYRVPSAEVQVGVAPNAQRMLMFGGLAVLALVGLRAAKII
jgi:hypothetical protein